MIFRKRFKDDTQSFHDGRNIFSEEGALEGEAAGQLVKSPPEAYPVPLPKHDGVRAVPHTAATAPEPEPPSYYGRPVVKSPVWIWTIPVYFFVGGAAGCAGVLAAATQLSGESSLRPLTQKLRWWNAVGTTVGAGLLIADLGRPSRFLNMLRVFRPTSPMNMGAWMLVGANGFSGIAALLGSKAVGMHRLANAAGLAAAAFDLPFTGYTAVLVANSAVPVWQGARKTLPPLFIASSIASTGSFLQLSEPEGRGLELGRRMALMGHVGELITGELVMKELALPEVKRPLQEGRAGKLWKAGKVLSAAALALSVLPSRVKWAHRAAGVLGTAGALATKVAVFAAGRASAQDPQATFKAQRKGHGAAQVGPASSLVQLKVDGQPWPLPSRADAQHA